MRDHLRRNEEDRDAYGELKEWLAETHIDDIEAYIEGKTEFILSILKKYEISHEQLDTIRQQNKS